MIQRWGLPGIEDTSEDANDQSVDTGSSPCSSCSRAVGSLFGPLSMWHFGLWVGFTELLGVLGVAVKNGYVRHCVQGVGGVYGC